MCPFLTFAFIIYFVNFMIDGCLHILYLAAYPSLNQSLLQISGKLSFPVLHVTFDLDIYIDLMYHSVDSTISNPL